MKRVLNILLSVTALLSLPVVAFPGGVEWRSAGIERLKPAPAPDFALKDLRNKTVSLKDLTGRVILLNFWATWCPPCIQEMPSMEKLNRHFSGKGIEVVAVNVAEDSKTVSDFVKKNGYTFRVLMDRKGDLSDRFGTMAIPVSYIIDRKGMVIGRSIGARDWASQPSLEVFRELLKR